MATLGLCPGLSYGQVQKGGAETAAEHYGEWVLDRISRMELVAEHLVELGTKFTRAAEVGLQLASLDWKFGNYWLPSGRPVRDLVIKATCRSAESNPQRVPAQRTAQVTRVTRPLTKTYRLR